MASIYESFSIQNVSTKGPLTLKEKRNELQTIRNKKIEGLMVRSRAKWIEHGEKQVATSVTLKTGTILVSICHIYGKMTIQKLLTMRKL